MIRILKFYLPRLGLAICVTVFAGCSIVEDYIASYGKSAAAVNYSDQSLYNYKQGQYYASAGRVELAKEYYLLALASTSDPEMQEAIGRDLDAASAAIQIQR